MIQKSDLLDNDVFVVRSLRQTGRILLIGREAASDAIIADNGIREVTFPRVIINHVYATEQGVLRCEVCQTKVGEQQIDGRTVSTQMVLFSTSVPGEPKITMPPS